MGYKDRLKVVTDSKERDKETDSLNLVPLSQGGSFPVQKRTVAYKKSR